MIPYCRICDRHLLPLPIIPQLRLHLSLLSHLSNVSTLSTLSYLKTLFTPHHPSTKPKRYPCPTIP